MWHGSQLRNGSLKNFQFLKYSSFQLWIIRLVLFRYIGITSRILSLANRDLTITYRKIDSFSDMYLEHKISFAWSDFYSIAEIKGLEFMI
jgi:hypothetical protein